MNECITDIIYYSIAVAFACLGCEKPEKDADVSDITDFISKILSLAFNGADFTYTVRCMNVPVMSKIPLLISINAGEERLFWYGAFESNGDFVREFADFIRNTV